MNTNSESNGMASFLINISFLLRDRLPTKANLVSRGILAPDLHSCVAGCGSIETAQHLFLSCSTFGSLWALVRSWIGFSAVDASSLTDHFLQFTYSAGVSELGDPSFSSYGSRVFGSCGMKEISGSSEIRRILFISFWTKSSSSPSGGCVQQMLP
ncbi:hypothetical protein QL285_037913 [Trifolium repens]|nr:hypothetical protein QL285_037913 [Trifolium repens]